MSSIAPSRRPSANLRLALLCVLGAVTMVGAAYASVPLYRLFCQVTGFDGTVRRAEAAPTQVLDRPMRVRFDTNVRDAPIRFRAEQPLQDIRVGETALAFFEVTNTSDRPITAQAIYNVVPEGAGPYFRKIQCFCFEEQVLQPGVTTRFPMAYFVDPEIADDPEARGLDEMTLGYTFFETPPA